MWNHLIEDIKVGVSEGGIACGPVSGSVTAEIKLRDPESDAVIYESMVEVEGTLNFFESDKSLYDILIKNDDEDEEWELVNDTEAGGYTGYIDFFEDLDKYEVCDAEHAQVWKLLVCLIRADWDEVDRLKAEWIGKLVKDVKIPVCDVEQEYLDDLEEDSKAFQEHEDELLEQIRAEYVGRKVCRDNFELEEGDTLEGEYTLDDTFQDSDFNEYRYTCSYMLDADGVITHIGQAECEMLVSEDAARCTYESVSAELAYDMLRDHLDGLM